jgi:hypothetical protein
MDDQEDTKPSIGSSSAIKTPSTPTKKKSPSKPDLMPNKSPAKLPPAEMQRGKRLALEALFDFAVKGPNVDIVAAKVSQLSSVDKLDRPDKQSCCRTMPTTRRAG